MTSHIPSAHAIAVEREANAARKAALGPGPEPRASRTLTLPVDATGADVRVRLLVAGERPAGLVVYLHGGGWYLGSIDTFDRLGRGLADQSGWAVAMVDYAKAPERPYPAAVEDAWAALRWAADGAAAELAAMGTPLATDWPLVVAGDSAGGNLATVSARRAREAGVRVDGQVLVYPVTDSDLDRPAYAVDAEARRGLAVIWDMYCPAERRGEPDAAPLRAASLAGLPPALVVTAEHDLLNSEVDEYAERLRGDGVPVEHHRIPRLAHGCLSYWGVEPEADAALAAIAAWLRARSSALDA